MGWRPGDQLPDWWELPTACPAGHPWGPGRQTTSWNLGRFATRCHPPEPGATCPWEWWVEGERTGGEWTRVEMPGRWHPHTGRLAPTGDAEVLVTGQWRRGIVVAWRPVPGNGWEAETRVDLGTGDFAVTLHVKPDRVRRRTAHRR
ncbi:MAG: hypothetical protein GEV07_21925 [Streptosporangiales bacterium]|nr:hypothetical protein [Streptosporangiales bacterium]